MRGTTRLFVVLLLGLAADAGGLRSRESAALSTVLADGGVVIVGIDYSVQLIDVPWYGLDEGFARIIPRKGDGEEHLIHVGVGVS